MTFITPWNTRLGVCLLWSAVFLALYSSPSMGEAVAGLTPQQEMRYYNLLKELRCLVCQNQTLAESSAELAGDLRAVVREKVLEDLNDDEIKAFMSERYSDFVLYQPPLKARTFLLWVAPILILALLFGGMLRFLWRQQRKESSS